MAGDDTIDIDTVSTDKGGHSITGGDGVDVFELITSTDTVEVSTTSAPGNTTRLLYSSQAEFLTQGDLVDSGTIVNDDVAMAVVAEKLTIKDTDEFDRFTVTGNRNAAGEGLYIATGDSVTAGSSITFAAGVNAIIEGVDLSAGTTGNSTIDASKITQNTGMILVGGDGQSTIEVQQVLTPSLEATRSIPFLAVLELTSLMVANKPTASMVVQEPTTSLVVKL